MYPLSLAQIFGDGAFQDANVIVIQKASLLRLTASSNNTAEGLLTGILITALANFKGVISSESNESITDENGQALTFDNSESFELIKMIQWNCFQFSRNNQKYLNNQIIVEEYTLVAD